MICEDIKSFMLMMMLVSSVVHKDDSIILTSTCHILGFPRGTWQFLKAWQCDTAGT